MLTKERQAINTVPVAKCNNCGSLEYDVVFEAGSAQVNQIIQCADCGLMYAFPMNTSNLSQYLNNSPATLTDQSSTVKHTADKMPDYRVMARRLEELLPRKGALCEIGIYSGVLLDYLHSRGWTVSGIEPDGCAVGYARRIFGLDVHHGTLDTASLKPGSIDAAIMLHVIEHLDDPGRAVLQVHRVLKPGGIFVVETPTYDSWTFKILGRRERSVSCDGHIFFYTQKTLSALLQKHGFEIIKTDLVGRTMSLGRLLFNIGVMTKNTKIQDRLAALATSLGLEKYYIYLNVGDMVRMYARKVSPGNEETMQQRSIELERGAKGTASFIS
jgi:2-polyprenyl-3-methyl-5-hydroxy-6-metoxy-1,4-benzoquinol methylase